MPGGELDAMWAKMMSLFVERRDAMFTLLHEHGLTPPHAHALGALRHGPLRMRDLADTMTCDASYITAIVDRLEELGLAERRPSETDRRAKEIALTTRGASLSRRIGAVMGSAPRQFSRLSEAEQATLAELMAKVVPGPPKDPFAFHRR